MKETNVKKDISSKINKQDLIEGYEEIKEFLNFLEVQIKNYEEKEK